MKSNPLMEQSEQLAVYIEKLCKSLNKSNHSNTILQIKKSSSSVYANISEAQYPQARQICCQSSELHEKNVLKLKVG